MSAAATTLGAAGPSGAAASARSIAFKKSSTLESLAWTRAGGDQWRCGLVLDETPQPDEHVSPLLADADRLGLTLGWGREFRSYALDLALMMIDFDDRTTRSNADGFDGTYESTAWLFGATVGF